ncbi:MAG: hypothetical protein A3D31_10025 [Candidatus Fluviicola riflensis]|nr:MAG: hypothetical protein CHH17_14440 [Candidatus Fluviicola riflensis]OGS77341.1 MAG: hypothetical protein A3D31_10025 [Candidatus Fluviicola riflensis]OGS83921.1 MAG: hypothetical protein A3E30_11425 [Fluviicola sp. RIFCSPHIGHO2_12_FULL_43_24]OGS84408.1 MAG: hypothetical protein A2724_06965 [Fluviicola sp. RIFCSPHIGHO2_01_FULL_43_53]
MYLIEDICFFDKHWQSETYEEICFPNSPFVFPKLWVFISQSDSETDYFSQNKPWNGTSISIDKCQLIKFYQTPKGLPS